MALFKININYKINIIFITSIIWAMNFRATFKNIYYHMGQGSYGSLKFNPYFTFIKNIICIFFFIGFYFESKQAQLQKEDLSQISGDNNAFSQVIEKDQKIQQKKNKLKYLFWLKNIFIIFIIYIIEDVYFTCHNNHILDRIVCPIRNLSILVSFILFGPLILRYSCSLYKHQLITFIIIFLLSLGILFFNIFVISRFSAKYGFNLIFYFSSFISMGLEIILIRYLLEKKYLSIYLILGIKGVIGTIVFGILISIFNKEEFINIIDFIERFEYEDLNDEQYSLIQIIIYILSLITLQYLKIYTINKFNEKYLLVVVMIADIIIFPFYCVERFGVQKFNISTPSAFFINTALGIINAILMLIFIEILECKFWGLDTNVKRNIIERQKNDYIKSLEMRPEDERESKCSEINTY